MVMHVQCWKLPAMHKVLLTKGLGPQMRIAKGYWPAMAEAGWGR